MKKSILSLALAASFAFPALALDVEGVWLTEAGSSKVEITDCGDGTPCGAIIWIDPASVLPENEGKILMDDNNPDASLRGQTLVGLQILHSFREGRNNWRRGKIYDPESGKTYGSGLRLNDDGTLNVKGCIGPLCQNQTWTLSSFTE